MKCCPNLSPKYKLYYCFYLFTVFIGLTVFILLLIWLIGFKGGFGFATADLIFNWHPLLMTIGMVMMFSQAILVYRTGRFCCKKNLKCCHALTLFTVLLLSILGVAAAFVTHNLKGIPNMYSLHSWLGMITLILFSLNFIFAFCFLYWPGGEPCIRKIICDYHQRHGALIFILAITTAALGLCEKTIFDLKNYKEFPAQGVICNVAAILLVFYGGLVVILVREICFKRVELPCNEPTGPPNRTLSSAHPIMRYPYCAYRPSR